MREVIQSELESVMRERDVRILLAVESGSRSWGIASEDSDYDVRFIYTRAEHDYLRLDQVRDTIEWRLDETLDITGWDLAKYLRLVRGSNPTTFEWLSSPIVYAESDCFASVRKVAAGCFSPKASAFHYLGMARGNTKTQLVDEKVSAKKYLYVLRALLAARWCLDERSPAPMAFGDLVEAKLPSYLVDSTKVLLDAKAAGGEKLEVARIEAIDEWVSQEDAALYGLARAEPTPKKMAWDQLNDVFVKIVCEATTD